jgi:two-component system, NarL family, sensor histidine kinase UhpB
MVRRDAGPGLGGELESGVQGAVFAAAARARAPKPRLGHFLHALWYRRSVRLQLLTIFILVDVIAVVIAGTVTILKARTATRVEIAASMELAELLVSEAVGLMQQEVPAERFLTDLSSQLRLVRHVRIGVRDASGNSLALRVPAYGTEPHRDERAPAPAWFAALIASSLESRTVPVVVNGQRIGLVEITGEPRDEIAEVWENTVALGAVALSVNLAVIAMLYLMFGRVLDPLTGLAGGLAGLEHRNYAMRLPRPAQRELADIAERFNALAQALETARSENQDLNRRLLTAQDDERRRTALELHDEVGPCLFGLKANAASIATAVGEISGDTSRNVTARLRDLLGIVDHLQAINRNILNRLRPMALGHVPLADMLSELVRDRARQSPQIAFTFSGDILRRGYGDSIDLTIYRCIQESLTNAIRHAQARNVAVEIRAMTADAIGQHASSCLEITIRDDGLGFDPATPPGFGMLGMQERLQALGGRCAIEGRSGAGTLVRIAIPIEGASDA